MNNSPVPLWIITEKDGTIICAHCVGCMAGLGECCSHIASVLFYLEVWTRFAWRIGLYPSEMYLAASNLCKKEILCSYSGHRLYFSQKIEK